MSSSRLRHHHDFHQKKLVEIFLIVLVFENIRPDLVLETGIVKISEIKFNISCQSFFLGLQIIKHHFMTYDMPMRVKKLICELMQRMELF